SQIKRGLDRLRERFATENRPRKLRSYFWVLWRARRGAKARQSSRLRWVGAITVVFLVTWFCASTLHRDTEERLPQPARVVGGAERFDGGAVAAGSASERES